jgi:hypothetical protein
MEIEKHKYYINAGGDIVFIKYHFRNSLYYPFGDGNIVYSKSGRYDIAKETKSDLICEVNPELLTMFNNNVITKKQFILEHINLYTKE